MRKIKTGPIKNTDISLPGSKSYTHRMLITAALSTDWCRIHNPLESDRLDRLGLCVLGKRLELFIEIGLQFLFELIDVTPDIDENFSGRLIVAEDIEEMLDRQVLVSTLSSLADGSR